VQVSADKFSKQVSFVGPAASVNPFGGTIRLWRLRSWMDRDTKAVTHQLYVNVSYSGDWRWYYRAADDHADDLVTEKIGSSVPSCVAGCTLSETIGVELPDALLRSRASKGFQIKLSAKSGDALILDLTPAMIGSQLRAVDGYLGAATASPTSAFLAPPLPFGVDFGTASGISRAMLKIDGGVVVGGVERDGVGARAGLHWADVIAAWDASPITDANDLRTKLGAVSSGQRVTLRVFRARKPLDLVAQF
jgi:hypothetical protein